MCSAYHKNSMPGSTSTNTLEPWQPVSYGCRSVHRCSEDFKQKGLPLDCLLNNIGEQVWCHVTPTVVLPDRRQYLTCVTPHWQVAYEGMAAAKGLSIAQLGRAQVTLQQGIMIVYLFVGVENPPDGLTADGFDPTLASNYAGHWYLTHLLLDQLKAAPHARVVNVSSLTELHGEPEWTDIM